MFNTDSWKTFKAPTFKQWLHFLHSYSTAERNAFVLLAIIAVGSGVGWVFTHHLNTTMLIPTSGGEITEGIVGNVQYLNPLFPSSLDEVDQSINSLIYSGLFKIDSDGNIVPDLVDTWNVSSDGKTYTLRLKSDIYWQKDNTKLTADDVIFTISSIQNSLVQSPLSLKRAWQGVKTEKIDDFVVKIILPNSFVPFLENLTIGIIPAHIFSALKPQEIISNVNNMIIGTGPFEVDSITSDQNNSITSIILKQNSAYYGQKPYLDTITFKFYDTQSELLANQKSLTNFALSNPGDKDGLNSNFQVHQMLLARYFALFFNQSNNIALTDVNVRKAIGEAVNKETLINSVLNGSAKAISSPYLSEFLKQDTGIAGDVFSADSAKQLLANTGWTDIDSDDILEKTINGNVTKLSLTITFLDNDQLQQTVDFIKQILATVGIEVTGERVDSQSLDGLLQSRSYQALLVGQNSGILPDPYVAWHSYERVYPGLNLSSYQSTSQDKLLVDIRQTPDQAQYITKIIAFQKQLVADDPALFLYSPYYLYAVNQKVKGVKLNLGESGANRFSSISKWYILEKRVPANQ